MDGATLPNCDFLSEALAGLGTAPKSMSPKWFYDEQGSHLFEQITQLPEYYPTRTETAILHDQIDTLAGYVPEGAALIELGSGASVKTRLLLDGIAGISTYRPLDISAQFLQDTA
ncbi:MAG: L-histidine N(alpha)-methyltransferase, partial [Pseudomonadota bacterium]|nr:L-histidine N(alpha)-methyltransferase [Pseudomonadota bacterium]